MEIYKDFRFEAAHLLPNVPLGHKCRRLHGHSYRVTIYVRGDIDPNIGWVTDFGEVKKIVQPVIDRLDHYYLNDIEGLENSTAENLSIWLWRQIKPGLPGLSRVVVHETCTSGCEYHGEHETEQ